MHEIRFRPGLLPKPRWGNVGTTADWQDSTDTVNVSSGLAHRPKRNIANHFFHHNVRKSLSVNDWHVILTFDYNGLL